MTLESPRAITVDLAAASEGMRIAPAYLFYRAVVAEVTGRVVADEPCQRCSSGVATRSRRKGLTMDEIYIRAREARDLAAIAALLSCPGVIRGTLQLPFRSEDERREQFDQRPHGSHSLVAEIDGRVVGQLGLHVQQHPRRRHCGSIGMAVHDDFTGRGVGSALVAAALELSDRWLGLRRIELEVYTDNAAAIVLYEKFGFVREGRLRDFAFRDGGYVDAYLMARVRGGA